MIKEEKNINIVWENTLLKLIEVLVERFNEKEKSKMPKKQVKNAQPKEEVNDLEAIVVDDMLGQSDWKKSKVGYLTGASAVSGVVKNQVQGAAESVGRISILIRMLGAKDNIPSLPDVEENAYDAQQRFIEAMRLHRMSDGMIKAAQSNSMRSAYLYGAILILAIVYFFYGLITWDKMPPTTLALHLAPIPLFGALCFRAVYTNYMFRNRKLSKLKDFFRSRDFMPR